MAVAVMRARPQGFVKEFISPLNSQGAVPAEIAGVQVGADGGFGGADFGIGDPRRVRRRRHLSGLGIQRAGRCGTVAAEG